MAYLSFFLFLGSHLFLQGESDVSNKAARIALKKATFETEAGGHAVSDGKAFLVLETEWENIHPKQKIEKSKHEGKTDRTMGVGGLRGGGTAKKEEYVDMDVTYMVKSMYDHAYVLADGLAYPLHQATEELPGGINIFESFSLAKLGDKQNVSLLFSVPENSENLAFQFFDYQYGHILLPIKGDAEGAGQKGSVSMKVLGEVKSDLVELAAHGLDFRQSYGGQKAPEGWQYAVVKISGKSLSGKNVRDIVQLKPDEYIWINADGGYLYYGSGGTTTKDGFIRFTPEFSMLQEVAFLAPINAKSFRLGLRVKNEVFHIDLKGNPKGLPAAKAKHTDGDIMEVMLLGTRRDDKNIILDLGITSLNDRSGLEIQTRNQFILLVGDEQVYFDQAATNALAHKPPKKFIVPPEETFRFELAYVTDSDPTQLYFRGYRSQAKLDLSR
jgi:hypothetical protein